MLKVPLNTKQTNKLWRSGGRRGSRRVSWVLACWWRWFV